MHNKGVKFIKVFMKSPILCYLGVTHHIVLQGVYLIFRKDV